MPIEVHVDFLELDQTKDIYRQVSNTRRTLISN